LLPLDIRHISVNYPEIIIFAFINLSMQIVFITGVSTGIGRDALHTLTQKGFFVIGTVRKQDEADSLNSLYASSARILKMDVRNQEEVLECVDSVRSLLNEYGLYALINNAGIAVPGPLQYLTDEEFADQMDVNVFSVRRITNILLPWLGADKAFKPGYIINISSVSGLFNAPYNGAYCISKHALESMTDVYRRELIQFGIRVTAIEPGPIKTAIWQKNKGALSRFSDTPYGPILAAADTMIEHSEKSGYDVSVISSLIFRILQNPKPKTRYLVHRKKIMFNLLAKWLPDTIVDKLVARSLAGGKKYRPV
jgi:NAD(P)-dependent dehydrogenase (short-subunit alcohol dehydrogenase family)